MQISSFQGRIFWGERIADVEVGPVEPQKQQRIDFFCLILTPKTPKW